MSDRDAALANAIEKAGGVRPLALPLEISPQAISQWRRVPATRVLAVEKVSGVPRHELRPDLYPPEGEAAA